MSNNVKNTLLPGAEQGNPDVLGAKYSLSENFSGLPSGKCL
jgi:hypothetical protein